MVMLSFNNAQSNVPDFFIFILKSSKTLDKKPNDASTEADGLGRYN